MIKCIVCGGRNVTSYTLVCIKLDHYFSVYRPAVEIVSGGCDRGAHTFTRKDGTKVYGADGLGERYAKENGLRCTIFPADWDKFGKAAGPKRNKQMAAYASHCVAFWDGTSKGTRDMLTQAAEARLIVRKVYIR